MADHVINGRLLSDLRVIDLRKELIKRDLPKHGSKKDLYERLATYLSEEKQSSVMLDNTDTRSSNSASDSGTNSDNEEEKSSPKEKIEKIRLSVKTSQIIKNKSGEDSSSNTDCGSSTEDDTETDAPSVSASEVNGTKDDLETGNSTDQEEDITKNLSPKKNKVEVVVSDGETSSKLESNDDDSLNTDPESITSDAISISKEPEETAKDKDLDAPKEDDRNIVDSEEIPDDVQKIEISADSFLDDTMNDTMPDASDANKSPSKSEVFVNEAADSSAKEVKRDSNEKDNKKGARKTSLRRVSFQDGESRSEMSRVKSRSDSSSSEDKLAKVDSKEENTDEESKPIGKKKKFERKTIVYDMPKKEKKNATPAKVKRTPSREVEVIKIDDDSDASDHKASDKKDAIVIQSAEIPLEEEEEMDFEDGDEQQTKVAVVEAVKEVVKEVVKDEPKPRKIKPVRAASSLVTIEEPVASQRELSPSRNETSTVIHIMNLVRPFTIGQLMLLIGRAGDLSTSDDGEDQEKDPNFWIDKVKSHCFVKFKDEESASKLRKQLHGTKWPPSNPKSLRVDFSTQKMMTYNVTGRGARPQDNLRPQKDIIVSEHRGGGDTNVRKEEKPLKNGHDNENVVKRQSSKEEHRSQDKDIKSRRSIDRGTDKPDSKAATVRATDKPTVRATDRANDRATDRGAERGANKSNDRVTDRGARRRNDVEPRRRRRSPTPEKVKGKFLDDLFKKTVATPCLYYLPLSNEQIEQKEINQKEKEVQKKKNIEERRKRRSSSAPKPAPPPARRARLASSSSPSPVKRLRISTSVNRRSRSRSPVRRRSSPVPRRSPPRRSPVRRRQPRPSPVRCHRSPVRARRRRSSSSPPIRREQRQRSRSPMRRR